MASTVTIDLRHVARGLGIPLRQVQAVVELLDEGNTIPFITRYRKDQTGGLDEDQVRQVQARLTKTRLLAERKQTILRSIEAQGNLTEELARQIHSASTTKRLEDLYLPFRPKKQTLATLARARGLEPLAREILEADPLCADLDARAADFVSSDRRVPTPADALLGAGHIIAEQFSERSELRQRLREVLQRTGKFVSSQIGGEQKDQIKPAERPNKPVERPNRPPEAKQAADVPADHQTESPPPPDHPQRPPIVAGETADRPTQCPADGGSDQPADTVAHDQSGHPPDPAHPSDTDQPDVTGSEGPAPPDAGQSIPEEIQRAADPQPGQPQPEESAPPPASQLDQAAPAEAQQPPPTEQPPPTDAQQPPPTEQPFPTDAQQPPPTDQPLPTEQPAPADSQQPAPAEELEQGAAGQLEQPAAAGPAGPVPPVAGAHGEGGKHEPKPARLGKRELKKKRAEEQRTKAFRDYFDYREDVKKIPPHRILAINRGERAKVLRVKIESDLDAMHRLLDELLVPAEHPHAKYLRGCARDALGRLILPSLERETRRELTERAEAHAVSVFARNLRNLLLQPPVRGRRVLAVDPGFRSGCKLAALDQFGNMLEHGVIFLVGPPQRRDEAKQTVIDLVNRYQLSVIVIGNGTACRQSEEFFAGLIAEELAGRGLAYVIVNEAGASVYSVSRTGREEFPDYDASLRGAISIGRRLQDPLSELVKIDAASIGVGLYQHDVKAKHLRSSLDEVVESCVNYVGVDANTASPALLRYVSGLNQLTARRLYEHRREHGPFRNREQLRDVPGFGEATFVQAAGFLKISGGDNPLDATWIHPESYQTAARVLESLECTLSDLADNAAMAERVAGIDLEGMAAQLGVGTLTLKDILAQLARPGRDPREDLPPPVFKQGILKLEDLTAAMELTGTVLNVVDFGAFVDIGMHDSGLVHVSQLADKYVRDPHEVVVVGQVVKVWVKDVDKERRRVSLSMIQPGTERTGRPRHGGRRQGGGGPTEGSGRTDGGGGDGGGGGTGGAGERVRSRAKPREGRPPRHKDRPRSKRPPERKGPPKPRQRPKPLIPITDAMKAGKEPLRTFGDLAQFFQHQQHQPDGSEQQPPQDAGPQPPAAEHESQPAEAEPPAGQQEPPAPETVAATSDDEARDTQDQTPVASSEVEGTQDQTPATNDETEDTQEQTQSTLEQDDPGPQPG